VKKNLIAVLLIITGGVAGYSYYYFIGCSSGSCPITSNPYTSVLYGIFFGYMINSVINDKRIKRKENDNKSGTEG